MPSHGTSGWNRLVLASVVLFWSAMSGTDYLVWRIARADAFEAALRSDPAVNGATFAVAFGRAHATEWMHWMVWLPTLLTGLGVFYFAPSLIAIDRRNVRAETVFMINFYGGLTIIGWVMALRMAVTRAAIPAQDLARDQPLPDRLIGQV